MRRVLLGLLVLALLIGTWWWIESRDIADNENTTHRDAADLIEGEDVSLSASGKPKTVSRDAGAPTVESWRVQGTVYSQPREDGPLRPLPNATIHAWRVHREVPTTLGSTTTDSAGRFTVDVTTFAPLAPMVRTNSRLLLWAEAEGHALLSPETEGDPYDRLDVAWIPVHAPAVEPVTLVLNTGTVVRGRVLLADGAPAVNYHVLLHGMGRGDTCTRPDGHYALLTERSGRVHPYAYHGRNRVKGEALVIAPGDDVRAPDLVAKPPETVGWIQGRVVHKDGTPLPGIPVYAWSEEQRFHGNSIFDEVRCGLDNDEPEATAVADEKGHFRIPLTEVCDGWRVNARLGDGDSRDYVVGPEVTQSEDATLRLHGHILRILLTTASGEVVGNTSVSIHGWLPGRQPPKDLPYDAREGRDFDFESSVVTQPSGVAYLSVVHGSTLFVRASVDGALPIEQWVQVAKRGAQTPLNLKAPNAGKHGRLTVRMRSDVGPAPTAAHVGLETSTGLHVTSLDWKMLPGRLTLPAGSYVLYAAPEDKATSLGIDSGAFEATEAHVTIRPGEETNLHLAVKRYGFLRLTVKGLPAASNSEPNERFHLEPKGVLWRPGEFKINEPGMLHWGLLPGDYRFVWKHAHFEEASAFISIKPGEITDVTLHATPKLGEDD